ncbi:hypothetical protein Dsin_007724 [Dipteronia sinensis]|uniref:EGF-like domain-containing protein n=1 Tax=Dipteronia sinensis TaxID=43782 RepID=A0AAE0B220_9ROSI|nr:hypothetical protein Dsin_007724 [Dipteronia sinensis]
MQQYDGACICNLPDPSTILDGDRSFLGYGKFCDEEMTMCDGTNTFWCEHGGTCEEIVQGDQCELSGVSCGQIFCFHEAQCLVEDGVCDCPPDWKGSLDCSLPTKPFTVGNGGAGLFGFNRSNCRRSYLYQEIFGKKTATSTVPKFRQLSQIQSHDMLDDYDEDDSMIHDAIHRDTSHL